MANSLVTKPISIDTDITTFRGDAAVKALGWTQGVRVYKLILAVASGGASSTGQVTITAPSDSKTLYTPLPVPAGQPAYTILFTDEPTKADGALTWRDFAVTGVSATGTILYLWTDV